MTRTTKRRLTLVFASAALLTSAPLLVGTLAPGALCIGRAGVAVAGTRLELAWGSEPISKRGIAWHMPPTDRGAMVLGPSSAWRPTTTEATITTRITGAPPVTAALHILFIPLLPWGVLCAGVAALLWWRTPRVFPAGCCQRCGYDLTGVAGAPCPECGTPRAWRIIRRLLARAAARTVST